VRVLLVHNRYRHPGGEERHLDLLESSLEEAGVDVSRLEVESSSLRTAGARLRAAATVVYEPRSNRLVREEVLRVRADVAHFHNIWPLLTPSALRGARDGGARTVLTTHNYRFACPNGTLLRGDRVHDDCLEGSSLLCGLRSARQGGAKVVSYGVALSIQRRLGLLARWVDAFVAPSRFVGEALRRSGQDADRIRVIPYGVPSQTVAPFPARSSGHILFAGRLSPEKGLDVLVEAAALAPEVPVVVAGGGPLAHSLARRYQTSLSLVGQSTPEQLAELRAASVASVVPSVWHDVAPFTAIESAAAGRSVVASRMGGLPELVEHEATGLLVEPNDPRALAQAMKRLWHDPALAARLGAQAADLVRREHDPARSAARHIELYQELLAE
jgi:glycosyltransferase involved in cell wall biosynthesis